MADKDITGYRFLDKDPIVDIYREAKRKSGLDEKDIHEMGGPTVSTLRAWDKGKTKKPQRLSTTFAMMALGYHEEWVHNGTGDVLKPRFKEYPETRANRKVVRIEEGRRTKVAAATRKVVAARG